MPPGSDDRNFLKVYVGRVDLCDKEQFNIYGALRFMRNEE